MSGERYYTTQDLMSMFGVSRYSIYRAIKSGALVVSCKGGYKMRENLFSEESLQNYLQASKNR